MFNHFLGVVRTPWTNLYVEIRIINQQDGFKDDCEFEGTLSSPSNNRYLDLFLWRRPDLDSSQEPINLSRSDWITKASWTIFIRQSTSLQLSPFTNYYRGQRLMDHTWGREIIRTWVREFHNMPINNTYMDSREYWSQGSQFAWHGRRRCATLSK